MSTRARRYREEGGGAGLVRVEVLVPPEGRAEILKAAARLRREGRTALPEALGALYDEALAKYGARCLWNAAPPRTAEGLRLVVDRLRRYGGMDAWRLALRIQAELSDAAR